MLNSLSLSLYNTQWWLNSRLWKNEDTQTTGTHTVPTGKKIQHCNMNEWMNESRILWIKMMIVRERYESSMFFFSLPFFSKILFCFHCIYDKKKFETWILQFFFLYEKKIEEKKIDNNNKTNHDKMINTNDDDDDGDDNVNELMLLLLNEKKMWEKK